MKDDVKVTWRWELERDGRQRTYSDRRIGREAETTAMAGSTEVQSVASV